MNMSIGPEDSLWLLRNPSCHLSPSPHLQATGDLLSATVDQFAFSGILCKWNHMVCILLYLTSVTQQTGFEIHPCCVYQSFVSFCFGFGGKAAFHCMDTASYFPRHLLGNIWVISSFWLSEVKLPQRAMY